MFCCVVWVVRASERASEQETVGCRDRAAGPPEYLYVGDDPSLSRSSYNVANPLKVVVHGFLSSVDEDMFDTVRSGRFEEIRRSYDSVGV